jgi:hypothetical protein
MKGGLVDLRPPQSPAENPPPFVITGLVPVMTIVWDAALLIIGMAGTRPAMT